MFRFMGLCFGTLVRLLRARRGGLSLDETGTSRSGAGHALAYVLHNHRKAIAAMDFFTVPTITFSALYCFFVISHDRRRILHFNVTKHPTSSWIVQQLREAFPFGFKLAVLTV